MSSYRKISFKDITHYKKYQLVNQLDRYPRYFFKTANMTLTNGSLSHELTFHCQTDITEQWERYAELRDQFLWWFEGVGQATLACLSLVLSWLALLVFKAEEESCIFSHLLRSMLMFDIIFLFTSMIPSLAVFDPNILTYFWTTILILYVIRPIRTIAMYSSIYMTIALSHDRYKSVSRPAEYTIRERLASTSTCGKLTIPIRYTISIVMLSTLFYFPQLFAYDIRQDKNPSSTSNSNEELSANQTNYDRIKYMIYATEIRSNATFSKWYGVIANLIFTIAIPVSLIIFFNIIVYSKVKDFLKRQRNLQNAQAKKIRLAYLLFGIVFLFMAGHALRVILKIKDLLTLDKEPNKCELPPVWFGAIIPPIAHLMISLCASGNFFAYLLLDEKFRIISKQNIINLLECFRTLTIIPCCNRNSDSNLDGNNPDDAIAIEMAPVGIVPTIEHLNIELLF